jgi:hypothetical protein
MTKFAATLLPELKAVLEHNGIDGSVLVASDDVTTVTVSVTTRAIVDQASHVGGAELTQAEFRDAAPDTVEVVDCPVDEFHDCDLYVVQNCVTYPVDYLEQIGDRPVVKYWHDVGPHVQPGVRAGWTRMPCRFVARRRRPSTWDSRARS